MTTPYSYCPPGLAGSFPLYSFLETSRSRSNSLILQYDLVPTVVAALMGGSTGASRTKHHFHSRRRLQFISSQQLEVRVISWYVVVFVLFQHSSGIKELQEHGVQAEFLKASFPTQSWPNYFTLVTGMIFLFSFKECFRTSH